VRERGELKGEMVLVVAPPSEEELASFASMMPGAAVGAAGAVDVDEALQKDIQDALAQGEPASAIAKRLSQRYSLKKRAVYERVLAAQGQ